MTIWQLKWKRARDEGPRVFLRYREIKIAVSVRLTITVSVLFISRKLAVLVRAVGFVLSVFVMITHVFLFCFLSFFTLKTRVSLILV